MRMYRSIDLRMYRVRVLESVSQNRTIAAQLSEPAWLVVILLLGRDDGRYDPLSGEALGHEFDG